MDTEHVFKDVLESHRDKIYRVCCCYVRDRDARDDVFQEVLIHLWKNLHTFQGKSQIGTWIYRITVNTCLRHLEKEQRRNAMLSDDCRNGPDSIPDASETGEADEIERAVHRLHDCINQLSLVDKTLISLFLEDLSTRDIAQILDITEVNVRVKLHRIRRNLRTMLERYDNGSR